MTTAEKSTKRSCVEKMAVAAGSLAAVSVLGAEAEAGVIHVTGSPVTVRMSDTQYTTVTWDVDGVNGVDFELWKNQTPANGFINLASVTTSGSQLNGRGFVRPVDDFFDNVQVLNQSFSVGPTLASSLYWGVATNRFRTAMTGNTNFYIGLDFPGFSDGDNYMGFRFLSGTEMHYGFAVINFDTSNGIVSITEWAYESTPDTAIHVEPIQAVTPVPEPSSLALLAMGAGGLLAYRARKKQKPQDAA